MFSLDQGLTSGTAFSCWFSLPTAVAVCACQLNLQRCLNFQGPSSCGSRRRQLAAHLLALGWRAIQFLCSADKHGMLIGRFPLSAQGPSWWATTEGTKHLVGAEPIVIPVSHPHRGSALYATQPMAEPFARAQRVGEHTAGPMCEGWSKERGDSRTDLSSTLHEAALCAEVLYHAWEGQVSFRLEVGCTQFCPRRSHQWTRPTGGTGGLYVWVPPGQRRQCLLGCYSWEVEGHSGDLFTELWDSSWAPGGAVPSSWDSKAIVLQQHA